MFRSDRLFLDSRVHSLVESREEVSVSTYPVTSSRSVSIFLHCRSDRRRKIFHRDSVSLPGSECKEKECGMSVICCLPVIVSFSTVPQFSRFAECCSFTHRESDVGGTSRILYCQNIRTFGVEMLCKKIESIGGKVESIHRKRRA